MYLTKKKTTIVAILILFAILVGAITLTQVIDTASAATIESYDNLDFKLVTNADGSQSYSVSIKAAYRTTAKFIVVPNTYNKLPVTEVAASGFLSCTKLTKVMLPKSVVTIGKNAFMNCTSLQHIAMSGVETIGDNAFAMCTKLDRLYFPLSVQTVGANILRNNANTIYLQSSLDEIDKQWSSTWNAYFTGETVENVDPSDMVQYREVLSEDKQTVVGYEIQEYQNLSSGDIVIYNMIRTQEDAEYLPVLNICSEAFAYSICDSLTIKDRHEDDPSAPASTHKVNIRSNAFLLALIGEINIQVGVTFNHPQDLQQNVENSMFDDTLVTGDAHGHSTRVFEESTAYSITLPADMDIITENMFKNCVFLESIKINGSDYDGTNVLPNVEFIETFAFQNCVSLYNLSIPNSVTYFGHKVFDGWGVNIDHQDIYLDFYEGDVVGEVDWNHGIKEGVVQINYKQPTTIYIDLQDGSGNTLAIQVKPGLEMPQLGEITRKGYTFKGIYGEQNGSGYQYYTKDMEVARLWQEGDSTTLYVNWEIIYYNIEYDYSQVPFEVAHPYNPSKYTVEDGVIFFNLPHMAGYDFWWTPASTPQDDLRDVETVLRCSPIRNRVYYIMNGGTNPDANPREIDITQTVTLQDPVKSGYVFIGWKLNGEYVTVLENIDREIVLEAIWEPLGTGTTVTPTNQITTVSDQRVIIDLTNASRITNCQLVVMGLVEELVIFSHNPRDYYMSVVVTERSYDIMIKLINVNLHGTANCDTISIKYGETLNLYAVNSAVYGQEGIVGTRGETSEDPSLVGSDGGTGGTGFAAINCYRLVIHTSVSVYGGKGGAGGAGGTGKQPGAGGTGGTGGYAVAASEIVVMSDGVKLVGGDGGRGGNGALDYSGKVAAEGGMGGLGSAATYTTKFSGTFDAELVKGQRGAKGTKGAFVPVT